MLRLAIAGRPSPRLEAGRDIIARVSLGGVSGPERSDNVLVSDDGRVDSAGYAALLTRRTLEGQEEEALAIPAVHSLEAVDHLSPGDIVAVNPSGYVRTLYRLASRHNALFATDRCNSLCLMCSQPPKAVDDPRRVAELLRTVDLMSPATTELGITGGEPTLLGDGLLAVIARCKERLPQTALHLLSNGRLFAYGRFARALAEIGHPDLMVGIPVYSDIDSEHDYVVQARGAFDETLRGLHNLGRYGVAVEIRVVVHRLTYARLPELSEYIFRNLPFAAHVTLMGLEPTGLALPNMDALWIDPWDYRDELERATLHLAARGMRVSIYNHQLCTLPRRLWTYARRSISDWKNEYLDACEPCAVKAECAGFFSSSIARLHSAHVRPIEPPASAPGAGAADVGGIA